MAGPGGGITIPAGLREIMTTLGRRPLMHFCKIWLWLPWVKVHRCPCQGTKDTLLPDMVILPTTNIQITRHNRLELIHQLIMEQRTGMEEVGVPQVEEIDHHQIGRAHV